MHTIKLPDKFWDNRSQQIMYGSNGTKYNSQWRQYLNIYTELFKRECQNQLLECTVSDEQVTAE